MTKRFELAALPWSAWKNGAGRTREIAVEPPDAGAGGFDWRVSVAEVAADAPFSAFAGVDRCIVLLRGAGMRLHTADGHVAHTLDQPGQPWRFDGGMALAARLLDGPCLDFNVMTRRGRWQADLRALAAPARLEGADALLVLATGGAPRLDGEPLPVDAGRLWRHPRGDLNLAGRGTVLALRLTRLDPP